MSINVMDLVMERIIADIEKNGVLPWQQPWCSVQGSYNRFSGKTYSFLNQMLLGGSGKEFATYKQWTKAGYTVRRTADARMVVYWRFPDDSDTDIDLDETNEQTDQPDYHGDYDHRRKHKKKKRPVLRYYKVFSVNDIVENPNPVKDETTEPFSTTKPIDRAEELLHKYLNREGIRLECNMSSEAYYSPLRDVIHLPKITQFKDSESFYATALHEAVHSTGAETRLDRKSMRNVVFGSASYSKEELIAEIGSSCLMHYLGINTEETDLNASAYVQGWLRALRSDRQMLVYASGSAQHAVKYILGSIQR